MHSPIVCSALEIGVLKVMLCFITRLQTVLRSYKNAFALIQLQFIREKLNDANNCFTLKDWQFCSDIKLDGSPFHFVSFFLLLQSHQKLRQLKAAYSTINDMIRIWSSFTHIRMIFSQSQLLLHLHASLFNFQSHGQMHCFFISYLLMNATVSLI